MSPGDGFFGSLVDEKRIFPDLAGATASEVLTEMADGLARGGAVSDGEDAARPHSDARIMQKLRAEGIQIARRTVAKYREELRIPSSSQRKQSF